MLSFCCITQSISLALPNTRRNIAFTGHSKRQNPDNTNSNHSHNNSNSIHVPWLIVGGGIHGVHIAARLLGSDGAVINPEDLCIIDGNRHLLQK
jgi:hypothetical protein